MLKDKYEFADLIEIMRLLRSENGCPWDREQTYQSLKKYLIEETYEVLEAVDSNNRNSLCEELGDLLLQVAFMTQIAAEEKAFSIEDVVNGICRKLITRHIHIFGEDKADTAEEVVSNWEAIKKKEKGIERQTDVLKNVPANLPALMRSYKVQQKAAQVGFDWDNAEDAFAKVIEEINELKDVYRSKNVERINDEMGDTLFSLVNLSRFLKVQPELALTGTINKFIKRFEYIEDESAKAGKRMEDITLKEMDDLWNKAKIHISV